MLNDLIADIAAMCYQGMLKCACPEALPCYVAQYAEAPPAFGHHHASMNSFAFHHNVLCGYSMTSSWTATAGYRLHIHTIWLMLCHTTATTQAWIVTHWQTKYVAYQLHVIW